MTEVRDKIWKVRDVVEAGCDDICCRIGLPKQSHPNQYQMPVARKKLRAVVK